MTEGREGYILWKGKCVEHFSPDYIYTDRAKKYTKELARRCQILESEDKHINTWTVVVTWPDEKDGAVPEGLKSAIMKITELYGINGVCDEMYMTNVVARELGIGDGNSNFYSFEVKQTASQQTHEKLTKAIERIRFAYGSFSTDKTCLYKTISDEMKLSNEHGELLEIVVVH